MRPTTLRARLVALLLLLLAGAGTVIGLVITLALQQHLVRQLDDDLRIAGSIVGRLGPPDELVGAADPPAGAPPPTGVPVGPGLQVGSLVALVVDGAVERAAVLDETGTRERVPADVAAPILALPTAAPPRSADLGELGRYRLVATPGAAPDGAPVVVVTGLSERRVQEVVTALVTTEVVAVSVTLLGAGIAGAVAVGRSLRPLEAVAATAARVSALPLERGEVELADRVDVTDARSEVGQVGTAFNRMLDHVDAALRERQAGEVRLRQFVADAGHELRTPLTAIRGYAELTRRDPGAVPHALERISASAQRMGALVEDLLLLARLDAGRPLEREPVDLTRLVVDAVGDAHVAGPGHRFALHLPDEPVTVPGDGPRLTQVVTNLLANARTHTPPGTTVTVAVTPGDQVALAVGDDGPGIAPELLPRVFERFIRGSESRSREHGSTGLGLAIVHAVVTAHDGRVDVVSRPGATTVTVRLPAGPQDTHRSIT